MKKTINLALLTLLIVAFIGPATASAFTAYFNVTDKLDLDMLDGFDLFVNGGNPPDFDLTVFYQPGTVDIDGTEVAASVPPDITVPFEITSWDIFKATYGVSGASDLDQPLIAGSVVALTSNSVFEITDIGLNSDEAADGKYPLPFIVQRTDIDDGAVYTATVPIPSAILLLGGGLIGLIAMRRRRS
jgi:hypothetical protein